jgi:hypothetical protein
VRQLAITYRAAGRLKCPLDKALIISNTMKVNMVARYQCHHFQVQF